MATNTDQIVTQLVADTRKFDGAMNGSIEVIKRFNKAGEEIGSRVKVLTHHMDEAGKKTDSFRAAMTRLSRDIKVANTVFDTFAGGIKQAYEAASEGAKILAAEQFFKNAGKSIAEYRKATAGMVSDAELMKKANLADSMGIDEKTFKKLVMVAEASALKTGQSFDYMFNSIIVGTARSSRLLLDNLGIIVSVGQANETYAAKVGKAVDALSAEEKQIAFVEEVARKSQGTLDEYGKVTDRTAESFARFDASLQNVADSLKTLMSRLAALVLPDITKMLNDLRLLMEREDWADTGRYIALRILQGMAAVFDTVDPGSFFDRAGKAFGAQAGLVAYKANTQKGADRNFYIKEALTAKAEIEKATSESLGSLLRRYDLLKTTGSEALDGLIVDLLKFNKLADDFLELGKDNFWRRPLTEKPPTQGGKGGSSRREGIDAADLHSAEAAFDKWLKDLEEKDFVKAGRDLAAPFSNSVTQFDNGVSRQNEYMKDWLKRWEEAQREYLKATIEFNRPIGEATMAIGTGQGLFGPIVGAIGQMSGGITEGITGALSGAGMGMATAGPLGAVLGALIPLLVGIVDRLKPVGDLINSLLIGLELLVKNGVGELLSALAPLGPALQDLLAAVGVLLGSALRPFVVVVTAVIGVVAAVVEGLALVVTVLSPFVEMVSWLLSAIVTSGGSIIALFFDLNIAVGNLKAGFMWVIDSMLGATISFNNAIVKIVRSFGLKGFGKYLDREDFRPNDKDPIDENTSALEENTAALRDFVREFRNLPQNYKAGAAIYDAQNPESRYRPGLNRDGIGSRMVPGFTNGRWRT